MHYTEILRYGQRCSILEPKSSVPIKAFSPEIPFAERIGLEPHGSLRYPPHYLE
ncbi:MAG: hypothetical protein KGN01_05690 [Patescibacteria group bacterium]|nr:hypothetical protein [Patescibacteria group bacterium]